MRCADKCSAMADESRSVLPKNPVSLNKGKKKGLLVREISNQVVCLYSSLVNTQMTVTRSAVRGFLPQYYHPNHDSDDRKVQYGDDCDTSSVGDFSRYLGFVPFIFHSTKLIICGNVSFQINQLCTRSPLDSDLAVGAE